MVKIKCNRCDFSNDTEETEWNGNSFLASAVGVYYTIDCFATRFVKRLFCCLILFQIAARQFTATPRHLEHSPTINSTRASTTVYSPSAAVGSKTNNGGMVTVHSPSAAVGVATHNGGMYYV